jgi:hypothetical protein
MQCEVLNMRARKYRNKNTIIEAKYFYINDSPNVIALRYVTRYGSIRTKVICSYFELKRWI